MTSSNFEKLNLRITLFVVEESIVGHVLQYVIIVPPGNSCYHKPTEFVGA